MSGFDIMGPGAYRSLPEVRLPTQEPGDGLSIEREAERGGFGESLASALGEVADLQHEVGQKAEALARGEPIELHDLFISMGKSDVAFNLMLEVRNKLLEAWETLSRAV